MHTSVKQKLMIFKAFREYNQGKTVLSTLPQISGIEITNDCNLNCQFCNRAMIKKQGVGYMKLSDFKHIVETYRNQIIMPSLSRLGEPMLHPDLVEMVRFLKQKKVQKICFTTNATLLTQELFKELVDAGLDVMAMSFEGTSKETYETLRRGANYWEVLENILNACTINYSKKKPVDLQIIIIDNSLTHDKIPEFVSFWSHIEGLNHVQVLPLDDWAGTFDISNLQVNTNNSQVQICSIPWFTVQVQWNGNIVPCCNWFARPFGNIFKDDLKYIWNSVPYQVFRGLMYKSRHNHPYCKNCKLKGFTEDSPYLLQPQKHIVHKLLKYAVMNGVENT